ncbi:unnamed protein product [Pleuronectes platessa]|uniref:Uncharacterized protein n=1 Tax=Pleuronectes platessa TaxID=8262 RepID=A0A9N7TJG6_PLEPL|nr:unnamed protein product [Pleuronectes platessa]
MLEEGYQKISLSLANSESCPRRQRRFQKPNYIVPPNHQSTIARIGTKSGNKLSSRISARGVGYCLSIWVYVLVNRLYGLLARWAGLPGPLIQSAVLFKRLNQPPSNLQPSTLSRSVSSPRAAEGRGETAEDKSEKETDTPRISNPVIVSHKG